MADESGSEDSRPASALTLQVEALARAAELGGGLLPDAEIAAAIAVVDKAGERLRHGTRHTVVAIAGATGSGKSSIVNRLAGVEFSDSSVRRPTTSLTHAVIWDAEDAAGLLDWLDIKRRHQVSGERADRFDGLILLDLPDHDSTAVEHRLEVDRLVELVDVLVWVTDPQKYADEALHAGYISRLSHHGDMMRFVLNQVDRLDDGGMELAGDFARLVEADGIADPHVVSVSALTGAGFTELESVLEASVTSRAASIERLQADVSVAATELHRGSVDVDVAKRQRKALIAGLGESAGSARASEVAAAHHQRKGILAMGWPFTRFIRRLGRKPLSELPGPGRNAAAEPRTDLALRDFAQDVSTTLEPPWPGQVRNAAMSQRDELIDDIRTSIGSAAVAAGTAPRWWGLIVWLQRVLALTAVVGLVWLLVVAILGGFFHFDTDPLLPPTPEADWMPLPSAMLIVGALAGLLIGLLVRIPLGVGSARRGRAARKAIESSVSRLADERVVAPVEALLERQQEIGQLLDRAIG
ncbi:MAG: ABC transporter [Acidimicrobiales bacterium]|nr:ABC transporter [Acidimicrobiales bacterium]RZV46112.1 MAG: ABC transporter [Acidimicrobiales bacterium]